MVMNAGIKRYSAQMHITGDQRDGWMALYARRRFQWDLMQVFLPSTAMTTSLTVVDHCFKGMTFSSGPRNCVRLLHVFFVWCMIF